MAGQWELFLYAGLLGVLLGAYYDVFRIIRYLTAQGKRQTFFWDLFYFFSSGVATFLFLLAANQGQMRFYLLAGELIGWCLYHLTLGQATLFISRLVVKVLQRIFSWIKRHVLKSVWRAVCWIWKKFEKVFKKALGFKENQRIIAGNAQFTGIAAGQGVGFTTGLLLLREGLGMRETPIRPHSWHCRMQSDYQYDGNRKTPPVWRRHRGSLRPRGRNLGGVEGMTGAAVRGATRPSIQGGYEYITGRGACAWPRASPSSLRRDGSSR